MNKIILIVSLIAYVRSDHTKNDFKIPHFEIFYRRTTREQFLRELCVSVLKLADMSVMSPRGLKLAPLRQLE